MIVFVQQLLDVFIKKFILCDECDNPETTLLPNEKKGNIRQTCKACGHQAQLDMRHKLTTFILKNPPGECLYFRNNLVIIIILLLNGSASDGSIE